MADERLDGMLLSVCQGHDSMEAILDTFFCFLRRKTGARGLNLSDIDLSVALPQIFTTCSRKPRRSVSLPAYRRRWCGCKKSAGLEECVCARGGSAELLGAYSGQQVMNAFARYAEQHQLAPSTAVLAAHPRHARTRAPPLTTAPTATTTSSARSPRVVTDCCGLVDGSC
jgi:hypothetical protein